MGWLGALLGSASLDGGEALSHRAPTPAIGLGAPSGQALESLVGYGMSATSSRSLAPGRRITRSPCCSPPALVLAISFGRLYLGTRYFSDVVSGLAAGGVWLATCITGLEVARATLASVTGVGGPDRRDEPLTPEE